MRVGSRSSAYAYDAEGDRAATSIDGVQTVYLPGGTELSLTNDQVTATRIYTYQVATIARRTAGTGGNRLAWCWSDGAGSEWQVDAADTPAPLARRADPFGGLRGPQPAGWSGDRGMAAGITDTVTGTLRLGVRDYDPVTGTFTQPDPILDTSDPAQWNPYSYGAGNPVDRPDPTGLAYCSSTACSGSSGSLGESGVITETPTRSSGGSSGSRGGGSGGGSRYHGGGYNGGGHRATRYTTPRTPARHATTKARYHTPTRPATVTPLPPPPNPYLTCRACTFIWVIPIAVGITEAAIDTGITIGIGISIGILADKIKERIHTAIVHKNESEPRSVDDILGDLPRGDAKKSKSYEVDSEEELEDVWKQLTEGEHTDAHWSGHAEGESIRRSDGVEVGIRNHSKSGGSTIDIRIPGESKMRKIHVRRR
ncbi:RHS repeat-associated core domain-containing protein [Acidipropionibacterium virtanenii]|uniref:RHS repeat-associated core domain-containing protein n=1 Tax=Acidipropionibacterium virtanenii TaxID=2057246 RepID=UPI0015F048FE|nr:RHS repeat-associated core domain-containing protein [Acidipropionibacterium virtanenii]